MAHHIHVVGWAGLPPPVLPEISEGPAGRVQPSRNARIRPKTSGTVQAVTRPEEQKAGAPGGSQTGAPPAALPPMIPARRVASKGAPLSGGCVTEKKTDALCAASDLRVRERLWEPPPRRGVRRV
jgi:hypothetical protein